MATPLCLGCLDLVDDGMEDNRSVISLIELFSPLGVAHHYYKTQRTKMSLVSLKLSDFASLQVINILELLQEDE